MTFLFINEHENTLDISLVNSCYICLFQMDDEGNIASSANSLQVPGLAAKINQNQSDNPLLTEKYTKLADNTSGKKLAPINQDGTNPRNSKNPLPPISQLRDSHGLDREKFPRYTQRLEFMPNTPTGSIAGSTAGSSIRSDMSRTRYEAESPDELALVRAASTYNCCLKGRSATSVTVWLPGNYCLLLSSLVI